MLSLFHGLIMIFFLTHARISSPLAHRSERELGLTRNITIARARARTYTAKRTTDRTLQGNRSAHVPGSARRMLELKLRDQRAMPLSVCSTCAHKATDAMLNCIFLAVLLAAAADLPCCCCCCSTSCPCCTSADVRYGCRLSPNSSCSS